MAAASNRKTQEERDSYISKWNILLENNKVGWILFQPQLGSIVYPCYSCRDIFSCKNSLLDHISRRSLQIKYYCHTCVDSFIFYNPCALLQHVREHFTPSGGKLDLYYVEISFLPIGMAGLLSNITEANSINDDDVDDNTYINSRFYNPLLEDRGKRTVRFQSKDLLFLSCINSNLSVPLILKQISNNIPKCKFVTTAIHQNYSEGTEQVKRTVCCPECKNYVLEPLFEHFLLSNQPSDETLSCKICKFISPSKCSLQAHTRTHEKLSPFVCPECGSSFENSQLLYDHMSDTCFHFFKRIKFRCPVQKCRKLFTVNSTFTKHFFVHFTPVYNCTYCEINLDIVERFNHVKNYRDHEKYIERKYECLLCKTHVIGVERAQHVEIHIPHKQSYIYVYNCKWCQATCRSKSTYKAHMKKCSKNQENDQIEQELDGVIYPQKFCFSICFKCKSKNHVEFSTTYESKQCTDCGETLKNLFMERILKRKNNSEVIDKCLLCQNQIEPDEIILHPNTCKYSKPVVKISVYDRCKVDLKNTTPDRNDESIKKKRKSNSDSTTPTKTQEVETPKPFDGIYHCKFCDYTHAERTEFHNHVVSHREIATSYQCMECGDCFVVKLSLIRHLMFYHKIANVQKYFEENECFDKVSLRDELKENQCSVCRQQFSGEQELRKHFRIHGMAFLQCNAK